MTVGNRGSAPIKDSSEKMLGTVTPLGAARRVNDVAYRSQTKMRNLQVLDSPIVLHDFASIYTLDLSDYDETPLTFGIDTSAIHRGRHEVLGFELILVMPATDPPPVTFPFVDTWLDFAGLWRFQEGVTYLLSFFQIGGKWFGAVNGTAKLTTKEGLLSRSAKITDTAGTGVIPLGDYCSAYEYTVTQDTLTFDFDTDALLNEKDVLCFDLLLTIDSESESPTLTFPVSKWMDFCMPARGFRKGKKYALTFFSFDAGETWVGRYNNEI